jgi:hypothetical protein
VANLRILDINAADSRTIKARFSANITDTLAVSNVQILSEVINVPDVGVVSVYVFEDILTITTLPQTPYARYNVLFVSTNAVRFTSQDGNQFLVEDGKANSAKVLGAENAYNPTRDNLITYLGGSNSVYDLSRETFVRTILNQISDLLNKAQADIRQTKSANYLEVLITDEQKIRSFGPWDRLNQEGAFQVLRVGSTPTNEILQGVIVFDDFPSDPVTLQRDIVTGESLSLGIGSRTYDDLVLTLNKTPITKLTSVTIQYADGYTLNYDIRSFGYQINNPKYDTQFGRRLITLANNQVKLNDSLKEDPSFVLPGGSDKIIVSYEYKSLGRVIDQNSVSVVEIVPVIRDVAPALTSLFSLNNAPVVTASDKIPTQGGIQFLDPYSATPFQSTHLAFLKEIPYREGGLPNFPGEYSVDYSTGRVFVYGAVTNDGTGNFPPVMNYYFRQTYVSRLDYTYVPEFNDLVASPFRELIGSSAKINYLFEQTFIPGIDYNANVHVESLNERVQNRIATLNSIYTLNSPITDVFKIFNETTGEVYSLSRFTDQKIFFNSRTPPHINDTTERANFTIISNETLILEKEFTLSIKVLKFKLQNNYIMSSTEDVIGSSFNSSVGFSQTDIFNQELYYDSQELTEFENINRLLVGQYQVNYRDGIVYIGVVDNQSLSVGTVSYKTSVISPINTHVISVSNVYASINLNFGPSKTYNYDSFGEGAITTTTNTLDFSDERFLNKDILNPYIFFNNTITVTDDIDTVRGIYDVYDLNNSIEPTNFADSATSSANIITLNNIGISKTFMGVVGSGLIITVPFISAGIQIGIVQSVVRINDQAQLLDGSQIVLGNSITLSVASGANVGDAVNVQYTVVMNAGSTPVIDYNRGNFFVSYSYCADEILVSYEWGDNVIDCRISNSIQENDTYYTTYTIGALRNSLLSNFGSLVQVDELQVFDEELDRETYRDILQGALQTFTQGPTITAIKQLISSVTKIDPEIIEATFWSLGFSYLEKLQSETLGNPYLTIGAFDQGLAVRNIGDGATLPISNNLRLEEGTLEMCVITDWDGIDNDATITFELFKNGTPLTADNIYIGTFCYNPNIINGGFSVNRLDAQSPQGLPALIFSKVGVFIYYDIDNKQWKVLAKDNPADGYVYSGTITSSGSFYNVKFIPDLSEASDVLRSGIKTIDFEFHLDSYDVLSPDGYNFGDGYVPGYSFDGIQFMSDDQHYFFDFGKNEHQNRFSLYKDGRGYLVFEIWDKGGFGKLNPERRNVYQVSSDIQNWAAGQKHNIGISWVLNSSDRRDEMHLYIDGFETPNLARYGNIPAIASTERFRTIVPEQIVGVVFNNSIVGDDLVTNQGSNIVTSQSFSFTVLDDGYIIDILEQGFGKYTISSASGNSLILNAVMPATLGDARFIINPPQFVVGTEIDIYKNIGVFVKNGITGIETEIPGTRAQIPSYSIDRNAQNQRVLTIFDNVNAGDIVLIKTFGLNHKRCRDTVYLWSDNSVLRTGLPPPVNLDDVTIKTIVLPLIPIGPENSSIMGSNFVSTFTDGYYTQPSNSTEGRILEVRVTGDNVDFTTPVTVVFNGNSSIGPSTTETVTFTSPGKINTINKWELFYSIIITAKPFDITSDSTAVEIKEAYSITNPSGNNTFPVIRFAYRTQLGNSLQGDGSTTVTDLFGDFLNSEVGNVFQITNPPSVAGIYEIEQVISPTTIVLNIPTGVAFVNGSYGAYSISIGRSGFQNGYFFLETAGFTNVPYILPAGWYGFDYASYLEVPFDPLTNETGIIGNNIKLQKPAKAIIDEFRILNMQLTDTRIGETIGVNEESITTGATKFSPFVKNINTLALFHFESLPLINDSDFYVFANKEYVQSSQSVNSTFGHSIVIKDKGLIFDNNGLLNTSGEGMVEFWISPRYDTYNDPNIRVYFDAAANVIENQTSLTKGIVKVSGRILSILYVRLVTDTKLQGIDYFNGGSVSSDGQTINLNIPLPYQSTPVVVAYIPTGVQGDRLTISKDAAGFVCFTIIAQGQEYQTRQPVFWPRDSWHRIRASFKFNRKDNKDELRLFVDGEERGVLLVGSGVFFGSNIISGQSPPNGFGSQIFTADINFTDIVQQFSLGQDFAGNFGAQARFDNLKISNKSIAPLVIAGQPRDIYFNTNNAFIYPSVTDAFTTFLLDFDQSINKTDDFAVIHDPAFGVFNFDINIIDSFGIVTGNKRVQTVLEALINALKPAVSRINIKYTK